MKKNEKANAEAVIETDESLANAIRRSINQISVSAIDEVEIYKNDSALFDEIVAHRIGLIPIKINRKLNFKEECSCKGEGCNKCQIQVSLKAIGPCTVYSQDIKGDVETPYEKMPIVILEKEQELELVGFVRIGIGKKHAKFSPGLAYYRNITNIKIKNPEKADKIIEKIKDTIIGKSKISAGETIQSKADADYIESIAGQDSGIEVSPGKEIVFFIESWGQMSSKEIFEEAVKSLENSLSEASKAIKK
ncbi:DNA-directed RNA polymerase subunit D [Candidatus Pacearchaeota archaeon]|nr:DNA-directed RNA polymerase subunit D [Candidatus Pacearchaeota archaeon]